MTTVTVQRGETLSAIAVRYGTTVKELVRLNNIKDVNSIQIGQALRLPSSHSAPTPAMAKPSRPGGGG